VTGLDYAMNRYYSSQWGRFTSPDPYGGSADTGAPLSWNRYAYVGGDPANGSDPSGLYSGTPGQPGSPGFASGFNPTCQEAFDFFNGLGSSTGIPTPLFFDPLTPSPCFGGFQPVIFQFFGVGGGRGGGTRKPPAPCDSRILQMPYLTIFEQMGKNLNVNAMFIMAVALQESGWALSHVYGTNSSSGGKPLNNLFGTTYAGGNDIPYPSVQASAMAWEQNWGSYLNNNPQTIQAFVGDLLSNPAHLYNSNPDWATMIEGGKLGTGKSTPGTFDTLAARGNSRQKHVTHGMFWASIRAWPWEPARSGSCKRICGLSVARSWVGPRMSFTTD
jgi:RHS repeat-associated protein